MSTAAHRTADRLGSHRVIEPGGVLPQAAWKLDCTPVARENEILCDVEVLNIDSASFRQICEACGGDERAIAEHIMQTVATRGKQHNPVTGSGGMFVGRVAAIGEHLRSRADISVGDRIASLVSLTLTPLQLETIENVDVATGRIRVRGQAILFESGLYAPLPKDIPRDTALAIFDVAGAPAQVQRLVHTGDRVVIIGADGKSGLLACAQAKTCAGPSGRVVGIGPSARSAGAQLLQAEHFVDAFVESDARDAATTASLAGHALDGTADVVINCVNVPGTELASILCARDRGTVYFFSMCTSFTAAALGAEGIGKDVTMIIGNGYARDHANIALATVREAPAMLRYFCEHYNTDREA